MVLLFFGQLDFEFGDDDSQLFFALGHQFLSGRSHKLNLSLLYQLLLLFLDGHLILSQLPLLQVQMFLQNIDFLVHIEVFFSDELFSACIDEKQHIFKEGFRHIWFRLSHFFRHISLGYCHFL